MSSSTSIHFFCGPDDFLVDSHAQKHFHNASSDSSAPEIITASASTVSDTTSIANQFIQATANPSLFGDHQIIWLRNINFLADSPLSRSDTTKAALDSILLALQSINPSHTTIILSASPIDRRTKYFKSLQKSTNYLFIGSDSPRETLLQLIQSETSNANTHINHQATETLLAKTNNSARLLAQEINKLITYAGPNTPITEDLVHNLVPQYGEGDFFEFSEAFFSKNPSWALDALNRYFFHNKDARPLLSSLQNRNRLLIQLRVLIDANAISPHSINKNTLANAAQNFNFDTHPKSPYNVFSQHPWYLSKLATTANQFPLKSLINFQKSFLTTFENILHHPNNQPQILQNLILSI